MKYTERIAYTLESYKNDIQNAPKTKATTGHILAEYTAATKRYKREIIFTFLEYVAHKESLDLTPTLASNLIAGWVGRSISRAYLAHYFSISGRTAAQKTSDSSRINELVEKYKENLQNQLKKADGDMKAIRLSVGWKVVDRF